MGGLIDDLWYLLFFKLFAVNIQDCPCKEKLRNQKYPDTCRRTNSIWIQISVGVEIFVSGKKKLGIQKYPDTSGRSLSDSR